MESFISQLCSEFQLWDEGVRDPTNNSDRWTFQLGEVRFARQECKILTKIEYLTHLVQYCSEVSIPGSMRRNTGGSSEVILVPD